MTKAQWHNAVAISGSLQPVFSDTKIILHSACTAHNSCWEGKGSLPMYSAHPAISQADLRECPCGSCRMFSDWWWVEFGQNNCGSCCLPWTALNTSSSGAWLFSGLLLCWSYNSPFILPPPQPSMMNYLLLEYSGLEGSKTNSCLEIWQLKSTSSIWSDKYNPQYFKKPLFHPESKRTSNLRWRCSTCSEIWHCYGHN